MKLRYLLTGLIFALTAPVASGQVFEMLYEGFETTEPLNFTVMSSSSTVMYDTVVKASGNRSLKLKQSTTDTVIIVSDTIDFTQNQSLAYVTLEFDHICNAYLSGGTGDVVMGKIYVKKAYQPDNLYKALSRTQYKGTSEEFKNTGSFNRESYDDWQTTSVNNNLWRSERFDLDNELSSVAPNQRKLIIKFVLHRKLSGSTSNAGWWLDNVRVRASRNPMITPTINMRIYPDGGLLPSSRGARVSLMASTSVSQGINSDSVYITYTVGSDTTPIRLPMTAQAATSPVYGNYTLYTARIPFEGYDTLMRFYCTVKDNTSNYNTATFPAAANSWVEYRCIRGSSHSGEWTPAFMATGSENGFPFPNLADSRSEWIYDSLTLALAGYKPGGIMTMRYRVTAANSLQVRPKFQIRMKNAPTNFTRNPDSPFASFTNDYMHVVYDSTLVIDEVGAGVERTIYLQDTFFYAGKDIVVQMMCDGNTNPAATSIATMPVAANKKSLLVYQAGDASYGYNTYTSENFLLSDDVSEKRPVLYMSAVANPPLIYDMGVASIAFPNETTPMVSQPSHLDVNLHNYGVATVNAIRIEYSIDDTINGYFDWTDPIGLAGGAETVVQVADSVILPAGYHYVRAWVADTLTAGYTNWRDHEPYNDTTMSEFIVCSGAMHGVRNIGGANPDFNTIDEFLFALSQCGVDDSLVVRICDGVHPPFTVPEVTGISPQHYLVFEPAAGANVTIRANGIASNLVACENTPYVRLRNLNFLRTEGPLDNMVLFGMNTNGCRVENCTFVDSIENPTSFMRIGSMVNTGFADSITITGCTITGGGIGINLAGQAQDIRSVCNVATHNVLYNQFATSIAVSNQTDVLVEKNELYDVLSNSDFMLRILNCYGNTRILSNKVYTSHGAQALGVSNAVGTATQHALIANNMVVCADDGLANQQNTPFNIIGGNWMDIVYNSVKMNAPERNNVAAATFGGATLSNSRFVNNIVACYDDANYAFNYVPGTQGATNTINHNIYFSNGYILNKRTGGNYSTLSAWQAAVEMDSNSVSVDPTFLNGSLVDLRTFNRLVKGVGMPLSNVTTDMFDTLRSTVAPCPGAFEFVSLYYDFEVEALLNPALDNCDMPASVEMVLALRNSGVSSYVPGGSVSLGVGYSINGTAPQTFTVTRALPSEDTIVINTGRMLQMPANGIYDSVYNLKVWTISPNDPNQTNDTTVFRVISRYHAAAPSNVVDSIPYNSIDTAVAQGVTQWAVYNDDNAPKVPSTVYWYYSPDDTEPFLTGTTYITDTLREDTNFYVRQQRHVPIVRITQVQLFRADTVVGLTDPMPEWIHPNTRFVVQLTNVGDDTAHLDNDSIAFVSPTGTINNKFLKFPVGTTIAPGASMAIQFHGTNGLTHQLPFMMQVKMQPTNLTATSDFAVVYRSHGVKDAVAFNNVTTASQWTNLHVPTYVWSGNGLPLANNIYCGVVRQSFNGNLSDWLYATDESPMHLASVDQKWLRYTANHCEGDVGVVTVRMINPPAADLELTAMPMAEGCGLGNEEVSVRVQNFGISPVNNAQLNYTARGVTVSETLTAPIPARGDTVYTFQQPLNMVFAEDTMIDIVIWANSVPGDAAHLNDTCRTTVWASHTPSAPVYDTAVHITYATSDTLTLAVMNNYVPVWYDYNGVPVDTSSSYVTDILYSEGYMGVGYIYMKPATAHVGTLANLNNKTAYPSPYQPKNKNTKQQFIYSASDLYAAGLMPGRISSIGFHLDSIYNVNASTRRDSIVFNTYQIYLGLTPDTIYSGTSDWKNTQLAYSRTNLPIYRSSSHGWVEHELDNMFEWDGVSSIVVQVVTEISTAISTGVQTAYTAKTNTTLIKTADGAVGAGYSGAGTKGNNRPDIMIGGRVFGCSGPVSQFHVVLDGVPNTDATVYMPDGSDTLVFNSCNNIQLMVAMRNMGRNTINGYRLDYSIDGHPMDFTIISNAVAGGAIDVVPLFNRPLVPGHHHVMAVVVVNEDSVSSNDTVMTDFNVRFCGGDYTIGVDSTADYHSFGEAVDSLQVAGIDGPVTFHVAGGVYNEQVLLGAVEGSSVRNTIVFRGSADSTTTVIAATTQAANYVFSVDGLSNVIIDSLQIISRPTGSITYAHAFVLHDCNNVTLSNSEVRVKSTVNNQNGSCVALLGSVNKLSLISNILDSGYYSFATLANTTDYSGFTFSGNDMRNFHLGAINVKGLSAINISGNTMRSDYKSKQTAVMLEDVDSTIVIQKNKIYLLGVLTGASSVLDNNGKQGLNLKNVSGSNQQWAFIANNMIGVSSNGVSGLDPAGILIDGTSSYMNIYYNTIRVYAGPNDVVKSKAFSCTAQTNHLQIMNNIFSNFSKAYAYSVASSMNITSSDYNDYFAAGEKFAYWGGQDRVSLAELQTAGNKDGSSVDDEPYFIADDDLHMMMTNLVSKAQYNTDVIDDIDDTIRSQMPAPTIGAQEMKRKTHNMSVVRIISPIMPTDTAFSGNAMPFNIEGDSILVKATFYNNGNSTETNIKWRAYLVVDSVHTMSETRNLGTFTSGQMKTDSVLVPTILGIINSQVVRVELIYSDPNVVDEDTTDNYMETPVFLAPAYNLEAVRMIVPSGCKLQHSQIGITVKNTGYKEIPAGVEFEIGYHAQGYYPSIQINNLAANQLPLPTMPDTVREQHHVFLTPLARNSSRDFMFDSLANLYPTDTALNIKVRVNGWCRYTYDVITNNDSTKLASSSSPQVDSWFTPAAPVGHDTTLAYGTWGEVTASQINGLAIRWYRDSTAAPFYSVTNVNNSRRWSTTPQYFHDSTYYLQCVTNKGCSSYFSPVTVHVAPRVPNDVGITDIIAPLGSRVYMENDTVRVQITNFGTATQSNFPVTYQLRKGNNNNSNPVQQVTETCTASIAPGQSHLFQFDSLLQFVSATQASNYHLRVWTDLSNDSVRRNDTIRWRDRLRPANANDTILDYSFRARGDGYSYPAAGADDGFDFTMILFNGIDVTLPPLGRHATNFGEFANPDYPVLRVTRGMSDSLVITAVYAATPNDRIRGKFAAYIDFNRSGDFLDDPAETVVSPFQINAGERFAASVTIPNSASYGYMRMRLVVCDYENEPNPNLAAATSTLKGHAVDFLLFVDPAAPDYDLAFTQIVSPRERLIRDEDSLSVSFRACNMGSTPLTHFTVHYQFTSDTMDANSTGSFTVNQILMPGTSTIVTLPPYLPHVGTTSLLIWHELESDTILSNNYINYEYHRSHTLRLRYIDDFDSLDYWYAPTGYNVYTQNLWQLGTPTKSHIPGAFSEPRAWVTDTLSMVTTGTRGNVSYLYGPIIDISQIRPDTISFRLLRNFSGGSYMRVEFYDFENNWSNLLADSMLIDGGWYNNAEDGRFDGTSAGDAYNRYWCRSSLISGDFQEKLQFRLVFFAPQGSNASASFGDGCAIDDFRVGRARRASDLGVVAITKPTQPKYGQTIYPEVVVKNYGLDTARSVQVGYIHYGTNLSRISTFDCTIPPGGTDTFLCTSPFTITSDFPDTFDITAFTILAADIYYDNDSCTHYFHLSPLENDIAAEDFVAPLDRVIAGDSTIAVTLRIRNFGTETIDAATLTYIVNDDYRVTESVDFNQVLGRPLQSTEYFNYTFQQPFLASMGWMRVVGIAKCDSNEYIYNDTIEKQIQGISSITDLAARSIIVDTDLRTTVSVAMIIENRGARGANDFEVGFWIDNDTNTIYRTTYHRDLPLPALTTGYFLFDTVLQGRAAPYDHVVAYVKVDEDNDPTNDTTNLIESKFVDLAAEEVVVEENAANDCRVYLRVKNLGNIKFARSLRIKGTINGNELSKSVLPSIEPMSSVLIEYNTTIPKDPQRHYVGNGYLVLNGDTNENNQTTIVRVVNYVENIPEVGAGQLILDQNYPNPFTKQTTIPFSLPNAAEVRFFVMDALGHIVLTDHGFFQAGSNSLTIDMDRFASGVYYYGIEVDGVRQMRKMVLR